MGSDASLSVLVDLNFDLILYYGQIILHGQRASVVIACLKNFQEKGVDLKGMLSVIASDLDI